jgi:hypothetical protein
MIRWFLRGFAVALGALAARALWRWGWRVAAAGTLWAIFVS